MKGILCDIGGVLYTGEKVIPGAAETIKKLKSEYKIRFLSNTSRKTPQNIYEKLKKMGFNIEKSEIFTALDALKKYLSQKGISAFVIATNEAKEYLKLPFKEKAVAVCDAYTNFNYHDLNEAFRRLLEGYEFLATNKNRYFKDSDGLSLDAGPFVNALEYASGVEAKILGKPSCEFFEEAINDMGEKKEDVVMIGDDIESDILGAKKCGIKTVLVKTGKFNEKDLLKAKPDYLIDSINDFLKICNDL
jgi:HAD superfamily hydrolase (TIGR01458 family)